MSPPLPIISIPNFGEKVKFRVGFYFFIYKFLTYGILFLTYEFLTYGILFLTYGYLIFDLWIFVTTPRFCENNQLFKNYQPTPRQYTQKRYP